MCYFHFEAYGQKLLNMHIILFMMFCFCAHDSVLLLSQCRCLLVVIGWPKFVLFFISFNKK